MFIKLWEKEAPVVLTCSRLCSVLNGLELLSRVLGILPTEKIKGKEQTMVNNVPRTELQESEWSSPVTQLLTLKDCVIWHWHSTVQLITICKKFPVKSEESFGRIFEKKNDYYKIFLFLSCSISPPQFPLLPVLLLSPLPLYPRFFSFSFPCRKEQFFRNINQTGMARYNKTGRHGTNL